MRFRWFLLLALLLPLLAGCRTPYGKQGSLGGVRIWEFPDGKIEIIAVGTHHTTYDLLATKWRHKAEEATRLRGGTKYEIVSFATGREVLGFKVAGEGGFLERMASDTAFWSPKVARGAIRVVDPAPRPAAGRTARAL
jgi:hypothetical protein